jgi:hypothetical protein
MNTKVSDDVLGKYGLFNAQLNGFHGQRGTLAFA